MSIDSSARTMALPDVRLVEGELFAERYRVLHTLGEGGMGAVYRVRDTELDEDVALKVLRPEIASNRDAIERFRREVKLARRVTHPNVARTYDLGTASGNRFLTMELIEGQPLSARISHGKLMLSDTLRIAAEVCRGLAAAHAVGVIHRDLKPDNVLLAGAVANAALSGSERPVITDFGIARLSSEREPPSHTQRNLTVGTVLGTPAYMAPEQVLGQDPDGRADVYALGVMLFELLTGKLPFEGESAYAIAAARLHGRVPDVRELEGTVPDGVASLVSEAMSTRREERPDASSLLQQLEQLRGAGGPQSDRLNNPTTFTTASIAADAAPQANRPRSIAVLPFTSQDAATQPLARDLAATLSDAVSRLRALRVLPPGAALPLLSQHQSSDGIDYSSLGKAMQVDRLLAGTVRSSGTRLRVNLRMIDPIAGTQLWGERFDGENTELFPLEDAIVRGASEALKGALGAEPTSTHGPTDPAARALFDRAKEKYNHFLDFDALTEALELTRRAHRIVPDDASVMSLLGAISVRRGIVQQSDPGQLAEAEDWALRALNADPSLSETYVTLGLVRLHQGQLKSALRAFREALARNPRNAEASSYVGRLLVESGNQTDGVKRLEFALRIDPSMQRAWWDLARTYFLMGDETRFKDTLARGEAATGDSAVGSLPMRARLALWVQDRESAQRCTEEALATKLPPTHPVRRGFFVPLEALARGEPITLQHDVFFDNALSVPSLTNRAFMYQVSTELRALAGHPSLALDALEKAAALPFVDVFWLDHCPALKTLHTEARFARVRATVAARVQDLWA